MSGIMDATQRYRRVLAARILGLVGVAAYALPQACSGSNAASTSTTTGAGTTGTQAGSGGAGTTMSTGTMGSTASTGGGGHGGNGTLFSGNGGGSSIIPDGGFGDAAALVKGQLCFHWPLIVDDAGAAGGAGATGDAGNDAGDAGDDAGDAGFSIIPGDDCGPADGGAAGGAGGGGPCPTNSIAVIRDYTQNLCPPNGFTPITILAGPIFYNGDCCCYEADSQLCPGSGRPYLVEDRARVAAPERVAGGRGWTAGARPALDGLTAADRASLAEAWAADALLEHASVASFSRFSLALLAAGAPSDLVELAHRAALDEIQHARLCFALAAGYAGEEIAPGPFPLGAEVHIGAGLADLAASTVKEGCAGETMAAVMAAEQLARATDPAVRAALAQIAADEARHAELAWRTVAWAVREGGDEVRAAVARAFQEALGGALVAAGAAPSASMEAHGRLDAATLARVAASVKAEIVAPAATALLRPVEASPPRPASATRAARTG
jgi:hypothetical protein